MISILIPFIGFIALSSALPGYDPKILGGQNAKPHEYPYLVSLTMAETGENNCGGTILSNRFILTAGHCIYGYELTDLIIKAGKHNISALEETEQIRRPAKYIVHKEFSPYDVGPHDIGLIELDKPLVFTDAVKPIDSLPKKNSIPSGLGIVSGWGSISDNMTAEFPQILKSNVVPILPNDVCAKALEGVNYSDEHFCTGPLTGKIGHCSGDSGGPFVQGDQRNRIVIGVISFNYNPCGTEGVPPALTRISAYIDWINKNMK